MRDAPTTGGMWELVLVMCWPLFKLLFVSLSAPSAVFNSHACHVDPLLSTLTAAEFFLPVAVSGLHRNAEKWAEQRSFSHATDEETEAHVVRSTLKISSTPCSFQ